jgi:hypothetical protein
MDVDCTVGFPPELAASWMMCIRPLFRLAARHNVEGEVTPPLPVQAAAAGDCHCPGAILVE